MMKKPDRSRPRKAPAGIAQGRAGHSADAERPDAVSAGSRLGLAERVGVPDLVAQRIRRGRRDFDAGLFPRRSTRARYRRPRHRHRLILETFIGPAPTTDVRGRHRDDDPGNNAAANLIWGGQDENWYDSGVITSGESGTGARPANPQWFRDIRDQCKEAGVAYFHKQNGGWVSVSEVEGDGGHFRFPDGPAVRHIGKAKAGRLLGGVIHDAMPEAR